MSRRELSEEEQAADAAMFDIRPHLPPAASQLAEEIGLEKTMVLCAVYGGVQISTHPRPKEDHPLVRLLGMDAAVKLARAVRQKPIPGTDGLGRFWVPKADSVQRAAIHKQVVDAVRAGMSKRQAALRFRITSRWVREICNRES